MHDLVKTKVEVQWISRENNAFNELKQKLMIGALLVLLDVGLCMHPRSFVVQEKRYRSRRAHRYGWGEH